MAEAGAEATARSARQTRVAVWALGGISVLLVVIAAAFFVAGWQAAEDGRLLAAEGVAIEAEVVDRRIREERKRQPSGNSITETSYLVTIRYTPPGGTAERHEREVSRERYAALETGQTVTVTYAPSKPAVFEFAAGELVADAWWLRVAAVAMLVLAAGTGWGARVLGRPARQLRAMSERRHA
jgi:hypothetical protein